MTTILLSSQHISNALEILPLVQAHHLPSTVLALPQLLSSILARLFYPSPCPHVLIDLVPQYTDHPLVSRLAYSAGVGSTSIFVSAVSVFSASPSPAPVPLTAGSSVDCLGSAPSPSAFVSVALASSPFVSPFPEMIVCHYTGDQFGSFLTLSPRVAA